VRWCALTNGDWRVLFEAISKSKIVGGTTALLRRICSDSLATVRVSTPVRAIETTADGVLVLHDGGAVLARAVIVTVPLNTLAAIDFRPGLNRGRAAMAAEHQASCGSKVWFRVEGRMAPFFGYTTSDHPLTLIQYEYEQDGDSLFVSFGSQGETFDGTDVEAVAEVVRPWLPHARVLDATEHNWTRDEFSRGTWGMLKPRQLTEYGADLYRQEPPVFFGGADVARGWAGFIDGAIETGLRTADQAMAYLREA
jgi:monoamine oxidase